MIQIVKESAPTCDWHIIILRTSLYFSRSIQLMLWYLCSNFFAVLSKSLEYANLEGEHKLHQGTAESYCRSKPGAYKGSDGLLARLSCVQGYQVRSSLRISIFQ